MATAMTTMAEMATVMQKLGMTWEGRQRQHVLKWGVFEDIEMYGILANELRG